MVKPGSPYPVLTEESGGIVTKWYCLPPPPRMPFQVTAQHWSLAQRTREIYSWKLAESLTDCGGYMLRVVPCL